MPLYEFRCASCAHSFEEIQGIKDPPLLFCPKCRGETERKFFDWSQKLTDLRKYNAQIAEAPILPYILNTFLILLLVLGLLGSISYKGLLGFFGLMILGLGISLVSLIGSFPIIGPVLYLLWLGPSILSSVGSRLGLEPSALTTFVFWLGFVFSLLCSIFTTLYTVYQIKTPVLWAFLEPSAQEKFKYLLLSRLIFFDVSSLWFAPERKRSRIIAWLFRVHQFPAIRLMGKIYYSQEIPVGPIRAIEERKKKLFEKALALE